MFPASLTPNAVVLVASGKAMELNTLPWRRKPCDPVASDQTPTTSPAVLIPAASVEVAPGKRHVIGLLARTEPDADGFVTLFATVDGQLQLVTVATPAATVQGARAQAQTGNSAHVSAGLAGTVVAVAVRPGQVVARGETLLAIEAMKMETHIIAERDAIVAEVYVAPGDAVGPRDLLILLS